MLTSVRRLRKLRELMASARYKMDAYLVPMDDEHQSEYVAPHDARIRFISGFSGSAGQSAGSGQVRTVPGQASAGSGLVGSGQSWVRSGQTHGVKLRGHVIESRQEVRI